MTRRSEQGFALIVIAALFISFALIAVVMIDRANVNQTMTQENNQRLQLARLNTALMQYALAHGNLYPCPAPMNVAYNDPSFGSNQGSQCYNPAAMLSGVVNSPDGSTARGLVPVVELAPYGIDPTDAFDTWGNRILYAVNDHMTSGGNGLTPSAITLTDLKTGEVFRKPDFVLVSFGRDGAGAYPKNVNTFPNPPVPCPSNAQSRGVNCQANTGSNIFVTAPSSIGAGIGAADYFDDILSFSNTNDPNTCPTQTLGWLTNCQASFQALPKGYISPLTSNTATSTGYTGQARAICSTPPLMALSPTTSPSVTPSCTLGPCTPANWVTTTVGIIPGVCPQTTPYTTEQTATFDGASTWTWLVWTFTPSGGTCSSTTVHGTAPPSPYINSCGIPGGPVPIGSGGGCSSSTLTWAPGCSGSFPATGNGVTTSPVTNTASGYAGSATATCTAGSWGTPSGSCTANATYDCQPQGLSWEGCCQYQGQTPPANAGDTQSFTSDDYYTTTGQATATCNADGTWHIDSSQCGTHEGYNSDCP